MTRLDCPNGCGAMDVGDAQATVRCPGCRTAFEVDVDGEFDGGRWHDLTALPPVSQTADRVCAACGAVLGQREVAPVPVVRAVSHGLCADCADQTMIDAGLPVLTRATAAETRIVLEMAEEIRHYPENTGMRAGRDGLD